MPNNYIANNPESSVFVPHPTLQIGDSVTYNYTSIGQSGTIMRFLPNPSGKYKVTMQGANGCAGSMGVTASFYPTLASFPPAATNTAKYNTFLVDMSDGKAYLFKSSPNRYEYTGAVVSDEARVHYYPAKVNFPVTGIFNKVYVDVADNNKPYQWKITPSHNYYVDTDINAIPGKGAIIQFEIGLSKADVINLVIGQVGTTQPTNIAMRDSHSGATGGETCIYIDDDTGFYMKQNTHYSVFGVAAGGGGTNDFGYQGTKSNGYDASSIVYDNTSHDYKSITQQTYFEKQFVGWTYPRNGLAVGGFGGGSASDDSKPTGAGFTISDGQGTNYTLSAGTFLGLNNSADGNGKVTFELLEISPITKIGTRGVVVKGEIHDFVIDQLSGEITMRNIDERVTALETP